VQVFTASLAEGPEQVLLRLLMDIYRLAKISIWEVVSFYDASHHLLCVCDDASRGKEPQFRDKRVKGDKL
jgi:hypothetical protein